jgi:aspartate-semialdehyde dehydrogenase
VRYFSIDIWIGQFAFTKFILLQTLSAFIAMKATNTQNKVVIVGATGLVGTALVHTLERLPLDVDSLVLLASHRSAGKSVSFRGHEYTVELFDPAHFKGAKWVFFGGKDGLSEEFCPVAASEGAWVIDNSSVYRLRDDVPLVVPEVNLHTVEGTSGIIANPNCSTAQLALALGPIRDKAGLKRVIVSTYQSASGAGAEYLKQLEDDTRAVLDFGESAVGDNSLAFNLLPAIGSLEKGNRFGEEFKLEQELKKILEMPKLRVCATAVRVPTKYTHSESVVIETERPLSKEDARSLWSGYDGITVLDDIDSMKFPTSRIVAGTDPVWIGRIRKAGIFENDLAFWVVADNLLKGAALNAIQIAVALSHRESEAGV